jgi:N6-L-threonylcarbamoyladenine synthase
MTAILGIETSCDETAAAVVHDGREVLSHVVASQHDLHAKYRGVVPEIASRAHLERIGPVIEQALRHAGLGFDQIDAVAVGNRPGLIGSLIVGVSAAKAIAWAAGKPLIGVDHVQAHLHAASLYFAASGASGGGDSGLGRSPEPPPPPRFPALGLVVSGGHTALYRIDAPSQIHRLGATIDDAVGEAYDKAAVILQLPYPGGPNLDRLAAQGDPAAHRFPRSLLEPDSLDFSFSGLKTALLYAVRGHPQGRGDHARFEHSAAELTDQQRADLAASFQAAAVDTLIIKIERALGLLSAGGTPARSLIIGGGVSANSLLRARAAELGLRRRIDVHLPAMTFCLDNAAMIAGLAYDYFLLQRFDDLHLPAIATTTF